jgi:hypothetical protein
MILNPATVLNPIFKTLDGLIENDGVYAELGINAVMPSSG